MLSKQQVKDLAKDFRNWGQKAVNNILRSGKKYGVLCSASLYSNGKKG